MYKTPFALISGNHCGIQVKITDQIDKSQRQRSTMSHARSKGLATVQRVCEDNAIVKNDKGDIYVSNDIPTVGCDNLTEVLAQGDVLYYESRAVFKEIEGCYQVADVACKTVSGVATVRVLDQGHGFLAHSDYGNIFFPGSVVTDTMGGFCNLKKSLRIGDEVSFVAWDQDLLCAQTGRAVKGTMTWFRAEEVTLPLMLSSDPTRDKLGFVISVTP